MWKNEWAFAAIIYKAGDKFHLDSAHGFLTFLWKYVIAN